jgi:mannose-1-phosphate guanylyltransferase
MKEVAVIMAGGSGTRLWPASRIARPKQLLRIIDGKSLLRLAYERLATRFSPADIHVIALAQHLPAIAEELPELSWNNLIGEPTGRDTANAIALAAAILDKRHGNTTMGVFTADHVIRPTQKFIEVMSLGYELARDRPDALVVFGIKPTSAHTGMGYLQRGDMIGAAAFKVCAFKEKPDEATAQKYLQSGDYFWNSGMFVWQTGTILNEISNRLPDTHATMQTLAQHWDSSGGAMMAAEQYPRLPRISIDYAVMEKAASVLAVEMNLEWLDVGHWSSLPEVVKPDVVGNTVSARLSASLESRDNIIVADDGHLIATLGVKDLVVVHTADATLVCHRDQLPRLKELVAKIHGDFDGRYD